MKIVQTLRRLFFKKLEVPETNETKLVDAVQMWEVRWSSRTGKWKDALDLVTTRPELECFTSLELAHDFAAALCNAFALVRYSGFGTEVVVRKAGADVTDISAVRRRV